MSDISQVDFICRTADNKASLLDTQTFIDIKSNVLMNSTIGANLVYILRKSLLF